MAGWLYTPRGEEDAFVRVPEVHLFDEANAVIVMDDCCSATSEVMTLKEVLIQGRIAVATAQKIGAELGRSLARLHAWGSSSMDARRLFGGNTQARVTTAYITYGVVVSTLDGQDALEKLQGMRISEDELVRLGEVAAKGREKVLTVDEMVSTGDVITDECSIFTSTRSYTVISGQETSS